MPSARLLRRWAAIATLSAALERRVWIETGSGVLFPNLYVLLVGKAGIGKSVAINKALQIVREVSGFHLSPNAMSGAALIDVLAEEGERSRVSHNSHEIYHTMFVAVGELSTLINTDDRALVAALTDLYDCTPFKEAKRGNNLRHDIPKPHLALLCGTTPVNLLSSLPKEIWKQGLMSRVILIHTKDSTKENRLNGFAIRSTDDLTHDLTLINQEVYGPITWTDKYDQLQHEWYSKGMPPGVTHPQLEGYAERRHAHLLKLSMIACVDEGGPLVMKENHFILAKKWLIEAEITMPNVFGEGTTTLDAQALDEIEDFIRRQAAPVPYHKLLEKATRHLPLHSVRRAIDVLFESGRLKKSKDNFYIVNDD